MEEGRKNVRFSTENYGHISETARDTAKITDNHANRKWRTPFQNTWKSSTLDDLEGHWQPVRSAILAIAGLFVIELARPANI